MTPMLCKPTTHNIPILLGPLQVVLQSKEQLKNLGEEETAYHQLKGYPKQTILTSSEH
jgi:hypothetical protein